MREYALATGIDDPRYTADPGEVALDDLVAPPAFAATFTLVRAEALMADPELGLHWNLVHSAQRFTYHRPVRGGDVLECTPWIVDIADRGRVELLTYRIDCVDAADGTPVVDATTGLALFKEG